MRTLLLKSTSLLVVLTIIVNILPLNAFASTTPIVEANTQTQTQNYTELPTESIVSDSSLQMTDAFILYENEDKRSEFSKDFTLNNGFSLATVYPYAVHFEDGGQWKEIDHTLITATEQGTAVYKNKAGAWNVYFPQTLTSQNSVSVSKDGYTLSFGMAGELRASNVPIVPGGAVVASIAENAPAETYALSAAQSSVAQIQETNIQSVKQDAEHPETVCDKASSRLLYANVYGNTSIIYDLLGNQIKESIVIRSYDADLRGYRYALNTGSLIPELQDDGSIIMYAPDRQTAVFTMPAPYMVDSDGEYSGEVNITLSGSSGNYTLTYILPMAWLAEEDRAWPVILDPIVDAESSTSNIADRTVAEERTLASNWGMNACGYREGWGIHRFYMKFITLPELGIADNIVHAEVKIYDPYNPDTYSVVEVREVLSTWTSSGMTWDNAPKYSDSVSNFIHVTSSGYYTIDVTDLARGWYETQNTGMVFKMPDAVENAGVDDWKQFYSCEYGAIKPTLQITYRNTNGIESCWDYTTSSAGRAGTGYVNNATGNLTWVHDDIGFGGNRMPVSISHIYNANDSATNAFGMGYGWRTNYNQSVVAVNDNSTDASYCWEDGDGTKHYFISASGGTYTDEDNLGLTLTVNGSVITITDRYNNKSKFTNGKLTSIVNNQKNPSQITISYNSNGFISKITDGAGRAYNFTYTSSLLNKISYTGKGSTEVSNIVFAYSSSNLITITYKDGKKTGYGYSGKMLTSATDADGYKIQYSYTTGDVKRVAQAAEYSGSTLGSKLTFTYGDHQTKVTDHKGNYNLLQFNDWGNLVSMQDALGRAQLAQYAISEYDEEPDDATERRNQLRESSRLLSTAVNLLPDSSFESGTLWLNGIASAGHLGSKGMRVNASTSATYNSSWFYVDIGQSITFSAYVKTSSQNEVQLAIISNSGTLALSNGIKSNSDFSRIQVSYTNLGDAPVEVKPRIMNGSGGTVCVDCVQLEYTPTASRYNLLQNGSFSFSSDWQPIGTTPSDGYVDDSPWDSGGGDIFGSGITNRDDEWYKITGDPLSTKTITQIVGLSGLEGDAFIFSGWAMADAVPLEGDREFGLQLTFMNGNTPAGSYYQAFNTATSGEDWQFAAVKAIATDNYSSITVQVLYSYAANTAYFDRVQLVKERFGSEYTYDDNGHLISVVDEEEKTTRYTYQNNDLESVQQPDGAITTYTYDNYHNVKTVTTPEGVVYTYTYDYEDTSISNPVGNVISTAIGSSTRKIVSTASYSADGNILLSTTDALDKETSYGYNENTNVLEWVRYPNDTEATRTEYTYDAMFRLLSATKDLNSKSAFSAVYTYSNDNLATIQTNSSKYTFTYGAFGLRETIKVGNITLATYSYTDKDHNLSTLTYGNGDRVTYSYDGKGRLLKEIFEDGSTITYSYDSDGFLAQVIDSESGITTNYFYDFTGRLIGYSERSSALDHTVNYSYNNDNLLESQTENIDGFVFPVHYTYDRDNRISKIDFTSKNLSISYTYDGYGRGSTEKIAVSGQQGVTYQYNYKNPTSTTTSTQVTSLVVDTQNYDVTYSYTYDANGNILTVNDGTYTTSYVYDSANQLTRENNRRLNKTYVWTYDLAGNILSKQEYAYTTGTLGSVVDTIDYTYDSDTDWGDLLTKYDGRTISYDGVGNPTNDGTWAYTWVQGRQLSRMKNLTNSSNDWFFTYNADGMRTKRVCGSTVYTYVYNGSQLSQMTYNDIVLDFTYDASGRPATVVYDDDVYYYVLNLQGDVMAILDSNGRNVVSYQYSAWGTRSSITGSMKDTLGVYNPLRYRGYVYDEESGLYYLQSRYYNPTWGRFINADVLVSTGQGLLGNNMFVYCNNNPVNYKDLDGKEPITATITVTAAGAVTVVILVAGVAIASYCAVKALWEIGAWIADLIQTAWAEISYAKKATDPEPPDVTYPGDNPAEAPDGYEWRGPDEQGGKRGGYANPNGEDSWHPDLNHPDGVDPHWDYNDGLGHKWRVFPDHIELVYK